eukprot:1191402-Prorocentrum_minimum.AAC.1
MISAGTEATTDAPMEVYFLAGASPSTPSSPKYIPGLRRQVPLFALWEHSTIPNCTRWKRISTSSASPPRQQSPSAPGSGWRFSPTLRRAGSSDRFRETIGDSYIPLWAVDLTKSTRAFRQRALIPP